MPPETASRKVITEDLLQKIVHRIVQAVAPEKIIMFGSAARRGYGA